jgi:hypothetical protein
LKIFYFAHIHFTLLHITYSHNGKSSKEEKDPGVET